MNAGKWKNFLVTTNCITVYPCRKLTPGGIERNLLIAIPAIAIPAVLREDICPTCRKVFSKVFIKVLQVIFTEQALKIDTVMVMRLLDLKEMCTCVTLFMIHTYTFGRYPRRFVAWRLRSRSLSSSIICRRSASLSCSIALSLASSSLKWEINVVIQAGH